MLILKQEPEEVCLRQRLFFSKVGKGPEVVDSDYGWYKYKFLPGEAPAHCNKVMDYLNKAVWRHQPLMVDEVHSTTAYCDYLRSLKSTKGIDVNEQVLEILQQHIDTAPKVLVHGDATLENFVEYEDKITPIDPGLPRGFNTVENDKGKLLQSYLTSWHWVNSGSSRMIYIQSLQHGVTTVTLCSLLSHWYRILKNADRHRKFVQRYGYEVAVPTLTRAILEQVKEDTDPLRYRWDIDRLRSLCDCLLPTGI